MRRKNYLTQRHRARRGYIFLYLKKTAFMFYSVIPADSSEAGVRKKICISHRGAERTEKRLMFVFETKERTGFFSADSVSLATEGSGRDDRAFLK